MSFVSHPQARVSLQADATGRLALHWTGKRLPLRVLRSAAGYYIGTTDEEGPVSRESVDYFPSSEAATTALETGQWEQRSHP